MKRIREYDVAFVVICFTLLVLGMQVTRKLNWPTDLDQFRDISMSQTILNGQYGKDAYFLGETIWYNPGYHFLLSGASVVLKLPVPVVLARLALIFNILAPIAFYLMLRAIFGGYVALSASVAYLLSNNIYPDWASSLFSFSTFPIIISQAFLYITLAFFHRMVRKESKLRQHLVPGCLLGLTFLFNTVSALIAGLIILGYYAWETAAKLKSRSFTRHDLKILLIRLVLIYVPAFLISLIFLYPILSRYHFKILNKLPVCWEWPQMKTGNLPRFLLNELLQFTNILAAFGMIHLFRKNREERFKKVKQILFLWFIITLGLLIYTYVENELRVHNIIDLPSFSPIHQYFFFFKALSFIFCGYGLVVLWNGGVKKLESWSSKAARLKCWIASHPKTVRLTVGLVLSLLVGLSTYHVYSSDERLKLVNGSYIRQENSTTYISAYDWIKNNTGIDDVFLCIDLFSMRVVTPAGRKVVGTHPFFSSPYVDYGSRLLDRNRMFESLAAGDTETFTQIRRKYGVKYLITYTYVYEQKMEKASKRLFKRVFTLSNIIILKLRKI